MKVDKIDAFAAFRVLQIRENDLSLFATLPHLTADCFQARLLRRNLEEAEAAKVQLHAEVAAVRGEKDAAELERHKLVLAQQTEATAIHVQVCAVDGYLTFFGQGLP